MSSQCALDAATNNQLFKLIALLAKGNCGMFHIKCGANQLLTPPTPPTQSYEPMLNQFRAIRNTAHRKLFLQFTSALLASFALICAHATPGQPGTLDTTWGAASAVGAGKVITSVGSSSDIARAVAVQSDGKVVLAGTCRNSAGNTDFCATRYNADGSLDSTFDVGGKATRSLVAGNDEAYALAIQPNGQIVLAGWCENGTNRDFCALRLSPIGTVDAAAFPGTGQAIVAIGGGNDEARAVGLQPDGKIVLAGFCSNGSNNDFCALRLNADGSTDTTFGTGGAVTTPVGSGADEAYALAIQPDGHIVLAGACANGSNADFCAVRYSATGTAGAAGTGTIIAPMSSGDDIATAVTLQSDGKVVLAGYCSNGVDQDFCVLRLSADGTIDNTFDGDGKLISPVGGSGDFAYGVALQADGKLILAGYCLNPFADFCMTRHNTDGSLDTTFGTGGKVITPLGSSADAAYAIALQSDGKILLAGECFVSNYDFCVARFDGGSRAPPTSTCSLDIDGDGKLIATVDSLIHARLALGITGSTVINGITFPFSATRKNWTDIRNYLVNQCGLTLN
jgi:uncharacterized delta-60 repeat protein